MLRKKRNENYTEYFLFFLVQVIISFILLEKESWDEKINKPFTELSETHLGVLIVRILEEL